MRLSEAIRLGAMATKQAYGTSLDDDGGTCALGAALLAIGHRTTLYSTINNHFPETCRLVTHPISGERVCLMTAIRELNDRPTCWTREAIADWVETLEAAQATERPSDADACCSPASAFHSPCGHAHEKVTQ